MMVFSKNKRSQALFRRNPAVEPPPNIVFDGDISLADYPLEVSVSLAEVSVEQASFEYEILPDPEVDISIIVEIDYLRCGDK